MKIGFRTPSISKSFKARTTGRAKRSINRAVNPAYGKRGMGVFNNPKKAAYNRVYNRTTKSMFDSSGSGSITEMLEVLTIKLKEYVKPYKDAVKNKDYAGYCYIADSDLGKLKTFCTILVSFFILIFYPISKLPFDCSIIYASRYFCKSCKEVYNNIFNSKPFKIFIVISAISNPNLLLIVAPAYGIYRLCRKNRKAPEDTVNKEEDQKHAEYTEVKSIDDIQL